MAPWRANRTTAPAIYEVSTMADMAPIADVLITATGNLDIIMLEYMREMIKAGRSSATSAIILL